MAPPILNDSPARTDHHCCLPRINEPAPAFSALTTKGPRSLYDYEGKWFVLFSHPADFTPVCTTEFLAFAAAYPEFLSIGCELLALSTDSIYSHLAWVQRIKEKFGVQIPFPIIDDQSLAIAKAYGMIQPGSSDTATVRATFVIAPNGHVRAIVYYPVPVGRSVQEILRLVTALQLADHAQVATGEGWLPGDDIILTPPLDDIALNARLEHPGCVDWYFCKSQPSLPAPKKIRRNPT